MSLLRKLTLKRRMLLVASLGLVLIFVLMGALMLTATNRLQSKMVAQVEYSAHDISENIGRLVMDVQIISETYADNSFLLEKLGRSYARQYDKLADIASIQGGLFSGLNRFRDTDQISAIYSIPTGELFNFLEGVYDGEAVQQALAELDASASEKLAMYCWYPLQQNVLRSDEKPELAVFCSRRIYSRYYNGYPYVQYFAIPQQRVAECYNEIVAQLDGTVYVLNSAGQLLSTNNEAALESLAVEPALAQAALAQPQGNFTYKLEGENYYVSTSVTEYRNSQAPGTEWITMLMVPQASALAGLQELYAMVVLVLALCLALAFGLLAYLYRQFMHPISNLSAAMKRVDAGDFQAYAQEVKGRNEAADMLAIYNRMLASVNRTMQERLDYEAARQDLEFQVLTSQINPHFLYNTLETIVWKAEAAGSPDIGATAAALGDLYRLSISGGQTMVSLQQEIDHVLCYVQLQQVRYNGQFSFDVRFDVRRHGQIMVPKIILQPIVENIYLHAGLEPGRCVSCRISVQSRGGETVITVLDNGAGMDKPTLEALRQRMNAAAQPVAGSKRTGIGLYNIAARLRLYIGEGSRVTISSHKGLGTRVVLRLRGEK